MDSIKQSVAALKQQLDKAPHDSHPRLPQLRGLADSMAKLLGIQADSPSDVTPSAE